MTQKILVILSVFFTSLVLAQNPYIYIKDGMFMDACDEFNPIIMNYEVDVIKAYPSGDYHVSPRRPFCRYKYPCFTCGHDNSQWKAEMLEHLKAIQENGFNAIRLMGIHLEANCQEPCLDNDYTLNFIEYYEQDESRCYGKGSKKIPGEIVTERNWSLQGDWLQEVIDVIKEGKLNLKIILLVGGAGYEIKNEFVAEYLAYLSNRFKEEPTLWAYDLYNEPAIHDVKTWKYGDKYTVSHVVGTWYDSIRANTHSQYVTMGIYAHDVFNWDPSILPLDFLSFHLYPDQYYDFPEHGFDFMFENYKVKLWEFSKSYGNKLWIVGETGFGGSNVDNKHRNTGTEADQNLFIVSSLDYAGWYGAKGYSYFPFKENHMYDDKIPKSYNNYMGLVYKWDEDQTNKLGGNAFKNYRFSLDCGDCFHPSVQNYYSPKGWTNYELEGLISNNGTPVEDAYIAGQKKMMIWDDYKGKYVMNYFMFYTHSDKEGRYRLYTRPGPGEIKFLRVSAPGYTLVNRNNPKAFIQNFEIKPIEQERLHALPELKDLTIEPGKHIIWDYPISADFLNIYILEGASLTITSEVYLNYYSKIIIRPTGKLIINGGKLTSSCDLWKGIEVCGNMASSDPEKQGKIQLINGAIIENAEVAVKNYHIPIFTEGGIIEAQDAIFRNNKVAVDLKNKGSGCYFVNCTFVTDELFSGDQFDKFIGLYNIQNLSIDNCVFTNFGNEYEGSGIDAFNSSLIVSGNNTVFENLKYAINLKGFGISGRTFINECAFANNFRSIYVSGINGMVISENTFSIPMTMDLNGDGSYGIYTDYCNGFTVNNNIFSLNGIKGFGNIGLYVRNSDIIKNNIHNNTYSGFDYEELINGQMLVNDTVGLVYLNKEEEGLSSEELTKYLIKLYSNENTLVMQYPLAMLYFQNGDYITGQNILDAIPKNFDLTVDQNTDYNYFMAYYRIIRSMIKNYNGLTADQVEELYHIYESEAGLANAYALNLLRAHGKLEYVEPVILPNH